MTPSPSAHLDAADVNAIDAEHLMVPMRKLIDEGRGLALLTGLDEAALRSLENAIWETYPDQPQLRLAIALRFRALIDVFAARRLKDLLLKRGFRLIPAAIQHAAQQRLNSRFGFRAHNFVLALEAATAPATPMSLQAFETQIAA